MFIICLKANLWWKKESQASRQGLFPKTATPPEEKPQAGPPGGVPEEGSVVTGGDSAMRATAPEAFQCVEVGDSDTGDPDLVPAEAHVCTCVLENIFVQRYKLLVF